MKIVLYESQGQFGSLTKCEVVQHTEFFVNFFLLVNGSKNSILNQVLKLNLEDTY